MKRRRSWRSARTGVPLPAVAVIGALLFAAGWWVGGRNGRQVPPVVVEAAPEVVRPEESAEDRRPASSEPISKPAAGVAAIEEDPVKVVGPRRARVALVIDDLGRSVSELSLLDALGVPLSYAVLPFESRTAEVVAEVNRRHWELLCHLPMEPRSGVDPGLGALTSSMSATELTAATRAALAAVPGAVGVNNHMGSTLSADARSMSLILKVVAEQGLFYLDSRTSADSVAYRSALESGIPAAERQVFLDSDPAIEAIEQQFDRLLRLASERGAVVAIGHPHQSTLEVLAYRIPDALARGYEFVPVSYLLDRTSGTLEE